MNDSKNSSKGLLVLKLLGPSTEAQREGLTEALCPTAEALDVVPMVLPEGFDVELQTGSQALLERVCVALEALVAQGMPPSVSPQEEAPQALNARPTGLNSRPSKAEELNAATLADAWARRDD